jgi:NAD(P)H-flavin reductase
MEQVVLIGDVPLSCRVRQVTWKTCSGAPLRWLPGQHVLMRLPGRCGRTDSYSIASTEAPDAPGVFQLAVGSASRCDIGAVAELVGLQGEFVRSADEDGPALFIGAGRGVAPLRAMLQAVLARDQSWPSLLLAGARTERDLLFATEFESTARTRRRFEYVPTLSLAGASWGGRRGYTQKHIAEALARVLGSIEQSAARTDGLAKFKAYVCGPPAMVQECVSELIRLGLPERSIMTEGNAGSSVRATPGAVIDQVADMQTARDGRASS